MRTVKLVALLVIGLVALSCGLTSDLGSKDEAYSPREFASVEEYNDLTVKDADLCLSGTFAVEFTAPGQMFGFSIALAAADTVSLATAGVPGLDTVLALYGPADATGFYGKLPLAADDDSGADSKAVIASYKVKTTGKYFVILSTYGGTGLGKASVNVTINGTDGCGGTGQGACTADADCAVGHSCVNGKCQGYVCTDGSIPVAEVCGDGLDNDCDGLIDEDCGAGCATDADCAMGQVCLANLCQVPGTSCTADATCPAGQVCVNGACQGVGACADGSFPVAEACGDGLDNDCDGVVDEDCGGANCIDDSDCAVGQVCDASTRMCRMAAGCASDCDDANACTTDACVDGVCVHSPGVEVCGDGLDNDCDGVIDEDCSGANCIADSDCAAGQFCSADSNMCFDNLACTTDSACPAGRVCVAGVCQATGSCTDDDGDGYCAADDCDDADASIHPGAVEVCGDKVDNDCNGLVDENCGASCSADADCASGQVCVNGFCLAA